MRYTGKDELRSAVLCLKCNSIKPERAHHCSVSSNISCTVLYLGSHFSNLSPLYYPKNVKF